MTPREKAKELFNKMFSLPNCVISLHRQAGRTFLAKQRALIAADEIINLLTDINSIYNIKPAIKYWEEVKQEINNL